MDVSISDARTRRVEKTRCARQWSGIRESNPRLHLGKVAYYHYTNPAYRGTSCQLRIYSMALRAGQVPQPVRIPHLRPRALPRLFAICRPPAPVAFELLVDFDDSRRLHYGGLLLPHRESLGPLPVNVYTRESFAVVVEDGHLPVAVLPPPVSKKTGLFLRRPLGRVFRLLFHCSAFASVRVHRD